MRLPGHIAQPMAAARFQKGVSLFIVLIAMVLMSLAALGLIRMVDTGTLVVGNLAFKQGATSAADRGAEAAISWLQANASGSTLDADNAAVGYYATSLSALDVTGKSSNTSRALVNWDDDGCAYATGGTYTSCIAASAESTANGYTTRYVITRMCKTAGDQAATGNSCAKSISTSTYSPEKGGISYPDPEHASLTTTPYFRVIVRSEGPRNTMSYTETYVHF